MKIVVDASVAVKWALPDDLAEPETDQAIRILEAIRERRVSVVQPIHWLAEVAGVLVRLRAEKAGTAIEFLDAMELPTLDGIGILSRAVDIASQRRLHVFDTLYHAVALETGSVLISADERYVRKSASLGAVRMLKTIGSEFSSSHDLF